MTRPRPARPSWKIAAAWGIGGAALILCAVGIVARVRAPEHSPPAPPPDAVPPTPARTTTPAKILEIPAEAPTPGAAPQSADAPETSWAAILRDPARSLKERAAAARALAGMDTAEAFAALIDALSGAPPFLRAAIAESLGISPHPDALAAILDLLQDPDPSVQRGAVRGLAARGGPEAASTLADILSRAGADASVRDEAAIALGMIRTPAAFQTLARAALESSAEDIKAAALKGLGARPFSETAAFFEEYLRSHASSPALKAAALEALGDAEGDPSPLIARHLADPSPSVREAALEAMTMTEEPGSEAVELLGRLADEKEPGMRSRIYQALGNQTDFEAESVLEAIQGEGRPDVRVAGYDLLAGACAQGAGPRVTDFFERDVVPELQVTALTDPEPGNRIAAVIALRKAGTPGAAAALETIARDAADPKTAEAARMGAGR